MGASSSSLISTPGGGPAKDSGVEKSGGSGAGPRTKTACHAAHDELEARMRDEELGHRSRGGW